MLPASEAISRASLPFESLSPRPGTRKSSIALTRSMPAFPGMDAALIRELLEIPENEEILSVIALGERAVTPEKPLRRQADDVLKIY